MLDIVKDLLIILVSSSLVSNIVLSQFQGLCPFLGVSKKIETAAGMGGAIVFVITLASTVAAVIYKFILLPFDIAYSGYSSLGTVCRNVFKEVYAGLISGAWCISSINYNQLCSSWYRINKRTEELWHWI